MNYQDVLRQWHDSGNTITARTSGSTGVPQVIELSKIMVRHSACRTIDFFGITDKSRLHSCIAADYIGGKMTAIRAQIASCLFSYEEPSNTPLRQFSSKDELDMVSLVPSQMRYVLDNISQMPKVKYYLIGGSGIPIAIRRDIVAKKVCAYESYGMTETASHIAVRRILESETPFIPLPGITLRKDERDCLIIDLGTDGVIVTNDVVRFVGNNSEFEIVGRADHVIITGGKKVHPAEVENKISALFPDREICITSRTDDFWGSRVVLLVEGKENVSDAVLAKMKKMLEKHEYPKEVLCIEKLERTKNGKIVRKCLD